MFNKVLYFCKGQYNKASGEIGLGGCCNLLLKEGVAFGCPYSFKDIYVERVVIKGRNINLIFRIKNDSERECFGFKIGENAKRNLIQFLCKEIKGLKEYSFE